MIETIRPMDIEKRSFEIITELLGDRKLDPEQAPVIKRVIHTSADFDYADNLVFSPGAVQIGLQLRVEEISMEPDAVICAIRKDSGDDPDITDGTLIFAAVRRSDSPGISIDGGPGIGRVTKPGLDQSIGSAAINSVPRQMIRENVLEICRLTDYSGGLSVQIFAPEGEKLAIKTFNPRLGIVGGISILGTTGIVEPMSE